MALPINKAYMCGHTVRFAASSLVIALVIIIATGCSKKEETKPVGQVAAKVNADEITISQVNNVLSRADNLTPEAAVKAKAEILEKLIEQQLAKQQAITAELDRTPAVVQAIEAARDEILARAYLEKIIAALPKPSSDEAKKYYMAHPELFAQRRIFNLEELVIEPTQERPLVSALQEYVAKSTSLQDVAVWLQSQKIKFSANRDVRPAEALPLELLPKLQPLKDGNMVLVETDGGHLNVFRVVASQSVPVDEVTAMPRIQQFLFNQGVSKALAAEIKSLREKSDIAYLGEFVGGLATAETKAKQEAETSAKERLAAQAKVEAQAQTKAEIKAKAEAESQVRADALAKSKAKLDAQREAEAMTKPAKNKPTQLQQQSIDKALGGLK